MSLEGKVFGFKSRENLDQNPLLLVPASLNLTTSCHILSSATFKVSLFFSFFFQLQDFVVKNFMLLTFSSENLEVNAAMKRLSKLMLSIFVKIPAIFTGNNGC